MLNGRQAALNFRESKNIIKGVWEKKAENFLNELGYGKLQNWICKSLRYILIIQKQFPRHVIIYVSFMFIIAN